MQTTSPARGSLTFILGIAIFSIYRLATGTFSGDYPLAQMMMLIGAAALPFHLAIVWWVDGSLTLTPDWWKMLARGVLLFIAGLVYLLSVFIMPMSEVLTLSFTAPFLISLLAVLLLRERVRLILVLALTAGFVGVLLIVKPLGNSFNAGVLVPLLSPLCYAVAMISIKPLGRQGPAATMAFWGAVGGLLCATSLTLYNVLVGPLPTVG